jgi:secreted PhoX family phosphatase
MKLPKIFLAALLLAGAQAAADSRVDASELKVKAVEFTPTPPPSTTAESATWYTRSQAIVTLSDGSKWTMPLTYTVLFRSGDYVNGWYAGLIADKKNQAILQTTGEDPGEGARGPFFSAGADGTSLIVVPNATVKGAKGHTVFLINHLEYQTEADNLDPQKPPVDLYAKLPMAMNLTVLDQDPATGVLTPIHMSDVDCSPVDGLWIPCNGSLTPWMTHLGSEEYEPDARVFEKKPLEAMNLYLGTPGKTAAQGGANPYHYGHLVEVTVGPDGSTKVAKHLAMGRLSFELGDVMADRKTVYIGDDGDDVIRAMFVADKAGDLGAGTLYSAKWLQVDGKEFGKATLKWIRLGHASDAQVKAIIDKGTRFSDIWEVASADAVKADPAKHRGFKPLLVYTGTGGETKLEFYRLKPRMEQAAAFLETRRYAAYVGATTEFTKMEGQAHNIADRKLYTVISYIRKGMIEGQNKDRPNDDISLAGDQKDFACGAIYESTLAGGQTDSQGQPIASDWVAADMVALVHGRKQAPGAAVGTYDKCATEMIANPDNIRYAEGMRTLFVGEDSANHLNNFLWAYNVDSKSLVRLFSAPAGGEVTGLNFHEDVNGRSYITANVQHPGAAEDLSDYPEQVKSSLGRAVDQRGIVGYFGALPSVMRPPTEQNSAAQ